MRNVMSVIDEAHASERTRRQTGKKSEETRTRIQPSKTDFKNEKRNLKGGNLRRSEHFIGKGSTEEIQNATSSEKINEQIEVSKRDTI